MTNENLNYDELEQDLKKPRKNSRRKGANYERNLVKKLKQRFNKEFSRTPGSGAFATTHNHKMLDNFRGDLITPDNFKFLIEAKSGYDGQMHIALLFDPKSKLYEFIRQAVKDSKKAKKEWMVIWKGSRRDDLVFTKTDAFPRSPKVVVNSNCYMYRFKDIINEPDCYWFE